MARFTKAFVKEFRAKHGRSPYIGLLVEEIMPRAVARVSAGVQAFTMRNLFYAVREIYLTSFPDQPFYKEYNSFTQDFLTKYEKQYGRIEGMVREPRGSYASVDEDANRHTEQIMTGTSLVFGCGNKIIAVEKAGLWRAMVENRFDIKLDAILVSTQGFSTEAGREVLYEAYSTGLPVIIVHDFDINGVLIHRTLQEPTQRRDTYIPDVLDLGLNWEWVQKLQASGEITPEPVGRLSKQDNSKLEGLLERGEIDYDAYDFLRELRVELNALTPLRLMEFLETRLDELDLWKTTPSQEQLDNRVKNVTEDELSSTRVNLAESFEAELFKAMGLEGIYEKILDLRYNVEGYVREKLRDLLNDDDFDPELMDVDDFIARLRREPYQFWTRLANKVGEEKAEEVKEAYEDAIEDAKERIFDEIRNAQETASTVDEIQVLMEIYLEEQGRI